MTLNTFLLIWSTLLLICWGAAICRHVMRRLQ